MSQEQASAHVPETAHAGPVGAASAAVALAADAADVAAADVSVGAAGAGAAVGAVGVVGTALVSDPPPPHAARAARLERRTAVLVIVRSNPFGPRGVVPRRAGYSLLARHCASMPRARLTRRNRRPGRVAVPFADLKACVALRAARARLPVAAFARADPRHEASGVRVHRLAAVRGRARRAVDGALALGCVPPVAEQIAATIRRGIARRADRGRGRRGGRARAARHPNQHRDKQND
jgi:hypothetical protein